MKTILIVIIGGGIGIISIYFMYIYLFVIEVYNNEDPMDSPINRNSDD